MIVFYSEDLHLDTATLEADEYHHCCKVLRHKVGDRLHVTDGKGTTAQAELAAISKHSATVKLISKTFKKNPGTQIHLYVAPPKTRARWEWIVEKSVELGINSLTALVTQHSERSKINVARTEKIMRSAAMQSLRPYHPSYRGMVNLSKVLKDLPDDMDKYLAHYKEGQAQLAHQSLIHSESMILIGPEGDFSEKEIEQCNDLGFRNVNISEHRLRTETAAIIVVALLKAIGY